MRWITSLALGALLAAGLQSSVNAQILRIGSGDQRATSGARQASHRQDNEPTPADENESIDEDEEEVSVSDDAPSSLDDMPTQGEGGGLSPACSGGNCNGDSLSGNGCAGSALGGDICSGSAGGGCSSCGSASACASCGTCASCCLVPCKNCCPPRRRTRFYGEFLYLHPANADLVYAIPRNGAAPNGAVGVADPDYQPGFRTGFDVAVDPCSSIGASYTRFESQTYSQIVDSAPDNLASTLFHPQTQSAANVYLFADAFYDIDFDFVDLEYRALWKRTARSSLDYVVGLRYNNLQQDLLAGYSQTGFSPTTVDSHINFDGFGIRLGLEGDRCLRHGMFVYAQGYSNFTAGSFRASYTQTNSLNTVEATTSFNDDRVVTLLEAEAGFGWQSRGGRLRMKAGYYFAGWFNTLTQSTWIQGVQNDNYIDLGETLAFSGLRVGGEYRW